MDCNLEGGGVGGGWGGGGGGFDESMMSFQTSYYNFYTKTKSLGHSWPSRS